MDETKDSFDQFPNAKLTPSKLASLLQDADRRFQNRDVKLAIRMAMVNRKNTYPTQTGQYLSAPFNRSEMVIAHATGLIAKAAGVVQSRVASNVPKIVAYRVSSTPGKILDRIERDAALQENYHNGLAYAMNSRRNQFMVARDQAVAGVGWKLCYPSWLAWGLPDREYFEGSPAELDQKVDAGEAIKMPNGTYAEPADRWLARRGQAAKDAALSRECPMIEEYVPATHVRYARDRQGISWADIVEKVPSSMFGPGTDFGGEHGLVQKDGKIVAGLAPGISKEETSGSTDWWFHRFWTREEVYYYVNGSSVGGGACVYWAEHRLGRVPLFDRAFKRTGQRLPEDEYESFLDPAYALAPQINQLETLLSNVAVTNATPRWVIELADGSGLEKDDKGNLKILESDPTVGLDPQNMDVVKGKIRQLTIEDGELLLKVLTFYMAEFEKTLPPAASTGDAGVSGPAWTAHLMQEASELSLDMAVEENAAAEADEHRMIASFLGSFKGETFCQLTVPGQRQDEQNKRYMIEMPAEKFGQNLYCRQDARTARDKTIAIQTGMSLRKDPEGENWIDDEEFYSEYMGADDWRDMQIRRYVQMGIDYIMGGKPLPPTSVIAMVADSVKGDLSVLIPSTVPAAADSFARSFTGPTTGTTNPGLGGEISRAAGVSVAGMGQVATEPVPASVSSSPPPQVPGAPVSSMVTA